MSNVALRDTATQIAELDHELETEDVGFSPRLVRAAISHQTAEFQIEGLPNQRRMEGIVLIAQRTRVFYPKFLMKNDTEQVKAFTESRPFCSSTDIVNGKLIETGWDARAIPEVAAKLKDMLGEGGLECKRCRFAKWGSLELLGNSGARGQACNEHRRLLFWRPGVVIPILIPIPTTSITAWDRYCSSLQVANYKYNQVVTEIGLEKKEGTGGQTWSTVTFMMSKERTPEMTDQLLQKVNYAGKEQSLASALKDIFMNVQAAIEDEDTTNGNGTTTKEDF